MVNFKRVQAIPLSKLPARVVIRWETDLKDAELKDYEFCVYRSVNGQDGKPRFQDVDIDGNPITPTAPALDPQHSQPISVWIDGLDFPWFVDHSESLRNLAYNSYYRVACRNKKTQEQVMSKEVTWDGDLDLVGLYVVDEHNFLMKDVVGVPSLVYQRRRGGLQCRTCFDPIQKKRLSSSCRVCYGTNWVGGFFNPIDVYIDYNPNPKNSVVEQFGETNMNETNALLSNYPVLSPGDVIKELADGRMWRVVSVAPTEKRRCLMLQMARLSEIKAGDIEYTLNSDDRFQVQKIDELNHIKEKSEF